MSTLIRLFNPWFHPKTGFDTTSTVETFPQETQSVQDPVKQQMASPKWVHALGVGAAIMIGTGGTLPAIAQSESPSSPADVLGNCETIATAATLTGEGICLTLSGDRYEGDFLEGQRTGKGRYEYAAGGFYEGEFVNGQFQGEGMFKAAQGHRYEGTFANGQFNGQGTYRTAEGNTYTGGFLNNTFHGEGTYTYVDGRTISGLWEAGAYVEAIPEETPAGNNTAGDRPREDEGKPVTDGAADEGATVGEDTPPDPGSALVESLDGGEDEGEKEDETMGTSQTGEVSNGEAVTTGGSQIRPDALAPALGR